MKIEVLSIESENRTSDSNLVIHIYVWSHSHVCNTDMPC